MTSTDLVLAADQTNFTDRQLAALEQFGIVNVPQAELEVFFHHSKRCGLDPFLKQIYLIPRYNSKLKRDVWTCQTGIDGLRLIAERTGKYVGSESQTHSVGGKLISATVTVRKIVGNVVGEFTATAMFREYVQKYPDGNPKGLWATHPTTMLTKCAEALALRKAFPQDMFGIYSDEEMSQADNTHETVEAIEVDSLVSSENIEKFRAKCLQAGFDPDKIFEAAEAHVEGLRESQLPTLNEAFKLAQIIPAEYAIDEEPATGVVNAGAVETEVKINPDALPEASVPNLSAITAGQLRILMALCRGKGWDDAKRHEIATTFTGRIIESFKELSAVEASGLIDHIKAMGADD